MSFTDGATLTAAQMNALDDRTVPVFASAAARDAAIPTPAAGRLCVIAGAQFLYSGTAWVQLTPAVIKLASTYTHPVSNIVLADVPGMIYDLAVGTYTIDLFGALTTTTPALADARVAYTFSGTAPTAVRFCQGLGASTTSAADGGFFRSTSHNLTTAVIYGADGSAGGVFHDHGLLVVTVAGTLRLQFAQGTANAVASGLTNASHLVITRIA